MSEVENDAYRRQAERDAAKRQIRDDRDHAARPKRVPHCPLCGGTELTIVDANKRAGDGIAWGTTRLCHNCGARFR